MPDATVTLPSQRWRFIQWPFIWSLAVLAFVLGMAGIWSLPREAPMSGSDLVYSTLQLFVLNADFTGPLNWPLEIARFLAPGVMAYTAAQALIVLFREQLSLLRLRFTGGHVIVCGLGRTGFKIASDSLRHGSKVVIIEEDEENDWIGMAEGLGATVLVGDAKDVRILHQARVEHARMIVAVCGNDGVNVEVAIRSYELKQETPTDTGPNLACHIHIVESDLRALFKEHHVFTDTGDRCSVTLFNIYDTSARLLLRRHPLDREPIGPDDPRAVHLIVVGFGLVGESLVLQAARSSHFANGRRLRVTVLDHDPSQPQRSFLRRHPGLIQVCDLTFLTREADSLETLGEIAALCADPGTLATVAICFDNDTRGLSLALALLPKLKPLRVPILLRMTTDGGLTTLLDADIAASRLAELVKPFPVIGLSSENEALVHREMDAGARAIHEDYVAKRRAKAHDANDPSLRPWELLDEDLKDSNRQQADHIEVKLRSLGLTTVPAVAKTGEPITGFTPEEVETLSRMEHDRWNAERFLANWTHAPGDKNIERKTSPWLTTWENLPDQIREYDRETVRNIPHLMALSGRKVVRGKTGKTEGSES